MAVNTVQVEKNGQVVYSVLLDTIYKKKSLTDFVLITLSSMIIVWKSLEKNDCLNGLINILISKNKTYY